jgi:predicted  nucleic acid-binding Zn-ribbon protein
MKREDLTKLGLTDDAVIDAIMAANGKDIESHKAKLVTAQAELDGVKTQLTEAGTTIEGFKKLDVEGIKAAANEWKVKAEQAQADSVKQLSALKFDHALDGALTGAKARNAKAVKALLDMNNLKLNETDGSIIGLDDQLKKVKETSDYLFESDTPTPRIVVGGNNKSVMSDAVVDAARKAAGLPPAQ